MPRLTNKNLEQLATAVRLHVYDDSTRPESINSLKKSKLSLDREAYAWVFGPENSYLCDSTYKTLVGLGLGDSVVGSPDESGCLRFNGEYRRLRTIEEKFGELLSKYPAEKGYDVVVALHTRYTSTASAGWEHAAEVDADAAECLAKSRANVHHYDFEAIAKEEAFEAAHKAIANSGPLQTPEECLECGGTIGVEPGGMGCARCG